MDADEERKSIVNNIVKAIQSKTEKNIYVKFEILFRLYNDNVMEQPLFLLYFDIHSLIQNQSPGNNAKRIKFNSL